MAQIHHKNQKLKRETFRNFGSETITVHLSTKQRVQGLNSTDNEQTF